MPDRKPQTPRPPDDPAEYQRFLDMAKEVEADETPEAMDRALGKIDPRKVTRSAPHARRNGKPVSS